MFLCTRTRTSAYFRTKTSDSESITLMAMWCNERKTYLAMFRCTQNNLIQNLTETETNE